MASIGRNVSNRDLARNPPPPSRERRAVFRDGPFFWSRQSMSSPHEFFHAGAACAAPSQQNRHSRPRSSDYGIEG